jgi:hypothetical protein
MSIFNRDGSVKSGTGGRKTRRLKGGRMKKMLSIMTMLLLLPALAWAGQVHGKIKLSGKPIGPGIKVMLVTVSGEEVSDEAYTDSFSSYIMYAEKIGWYLLKVRYKQKDYQMSIYAYQNPTRYNLVLEKKKDGTYDLRRE